MKICTIIAEFNPFHDGHKYIIESAKNSGFTHIAVIMSGNFVQRGEPAIYSKQKRIESALRNGADLILELPCVWSLSSAEKYAESGVFLSDALGCTHSLVFGSECGNLEALTGIKNAFKNQMFMQNLEKYLSTGVTFAKARELAVSEIMPDYDFSKILSSPNNILGVEYLKAIEKFKFKISPVTFQRNLEFDTASKIREKIKLENFSDNTERPKDLFFGEKAIISRLSALSKYDISLLPDISEGIENKIFNSIKSAEDLENLLYLIKSKRYTMSRIKRIILCACLNISKEIQSKKPPYLRPLGATKKGIEILGLAKSTSKLPIISKYSDFENMNSFAKKVFEIECDATEFYGNFSEKLKMMPSEKTFKFIKAE